MADAGEALRNYLAWIQPTGAEGGLESMADASPLLSAIPAESQTEQVIDTAAVIETKISTNEPLDDAEQNVLEAIILPGLRPVVDVVGGTFEMPPGEFRHFGRPDTRPALEAALRSVGRVELPNHATMPYGGTGFLVGDNLLMTNRHVAEIFAEGVGRQDLTFRAEQAADVDFLEERDNVDAATFHIERIVMIHPYWDMALLEVAGLAGRDPLTLAVADPADLVDHDVAVIGYPAFDPRNRVDLQNEIFRGTFNVKRLQPGRLRQRNDITSFGHDVNAVTHDSSTLGGNSGSVVLDVGSGKVVALHFAGIYLKANYAVPAHDLALDRYVVDAGVRFDGAVAGPATAWDPFWATADQHVERRAAVAGPPAAVAPPVATGGQDGDDDHHDDHDDHDHHDDGDGGRSVTWTLPLEVTVRFGAATTTGSLVAAAVVGGDAGAAVEAMQEPFHDVALDTRVGYDEDFLGLKVPLPTVTKPELTSLADNDDPVLRYEHFSVVVNRQRRLALFSASNVDASPERKKPEPGRVYTRRGLSGLGPNDREKWYIDPRIPAAHQLPDKFYTKDRQAFDKGHIVRRDDAAWGDTYDEVRRGNGDTYYVTNCSPQVGSFNQKIWLQLENLILKGAVDERLCVLTGPVFADDDPEFEGVAELGPIVARIPQRYWKIAVARAEDGLQSFAFVLEQDLSQVDMTESATEFVVPDDWKARMISIPALGQLLDGFELPSEIVEADQFGLDAGEQLVAAADVDILGVPTAGPIVDIHCHTFNADDIPVKGFVRSVIGSKVSLVKLIDELIDRRIQHHAPGFEAELREIGERLAAPSAGLESMAVEPSLEFETAAALALLRDTNRDLVLATQAELTDEHLGGETGEDPDALLVEGPIDAFRDVKRWIRWALLFAKPRIRLTEMMATRYPEVALFTPLLVDLAPGLGDTAETTIHEQLEMAAGISKVSMLGKLRGAPDARVHAFVGFDPRRPDANQTVADAIVDFGCIGVKLYPPMGFRPLGNVDPPVPNGMLPSDAIAVDESLRTLYRFCSDNDVPLTVHSNPSNFAHPSFEDFSRPGNWRLVLDEFPDLRLNLGHFGGSGKGDHADWPRQIAAMASTFPHLHADIGNHNPEKVDDYLRMVHGWLTDPAGASMLDRLMFGSDWFMLANHRKFEDFLTSFRRSFTKTFPAHEFPGAVDGFMGGNALRFLGFDDPANANNRRLVARYRAIGAAIPPWLAVS